MGRISEAELNRLKTHISLVRLVEAAGIELKKHGSKDFVGRCPFHDDKTPSLVITPNKNLWHCLGACNTGGSVVDWVMRREKVSFRHAVELLRADAPGVLSDDPETPEQPKAAPVLSLAVDPKAEETDLLNQVVDFYHATLKTAPEARAYLKQRGLDNAELIDTFKLGFANRTLGYHLPANTTVAGRSLRAKLCKLGLLRTTGHEHLSGSLVIPICDEQQNIQQLYGRKLLNKLRAGTAYHLYLPGPQRGVFNAAGLVDAEEVILCEALIDALTFWAAGYRNVTASYGVNGFTKEHLATFKQVGIKRVLIAYDRDEAGDKAADKLAKQLQAEGFACFRILFPKGMDANQYAMSVQPARQSLGLVISKAHWLGNGKPPALQVPCAETKPASDVEPATEVKPEQPTSSLVAKAAKDKNTEIKSDPVDVESNADADTQPVPPETVSPLRAPAPAADLPVTVNDREVILLCGPRRYRVRGLTSTINDAVMKINLLVSLADEENNTPANPAALHVDTFDLYNAKSRASFSTSAAAELGVTPAVVQHDLGRILLALEGVQDNRTESKPEPTDDVLSDADETAALDLLRDPNLITRISDDITATGLVGEPVNGLVSYLAAISRKLPQPLAIIIQSTSAAGKSALMDAVLDLVPDEDRVQYSAMTGQSLFYLGETDLKHRILGIAEEEGVRQASYALKLLQSQGELTIASTGKDPDSGKLITEAYRVEGPVMLLLTTTAIDIDEELLNRCLVLTVNESREQTRLIQQTQRQARTLSGLQRHTKASAIKALHRNAQRLLQPLAVVNPYAEQLTFLDERPRTRRDHQKYLTLIDAIALLHQHQREIKYLPQSGPVTGTDKPQGYVEVTLEDIALANQLAHTVLGRSLDELPPVTRSLLGHIVDYVNEHSERDAIARNAIRFTRRQLRQIISWGDTQLKTHLSRLVELEYLLLHRQGQTHAYELAYDGDEKHNEPFLMGLLDVETLRTMSNRSGQNTGWSGQGSQRSAPGRGVVGARKTPQTQARQGFPAKKAILRPKRT